MLTIILKIDNLQKIYTKTQHKTEENWVKEFDKKFEADEEMNLYGIEWYIMLIIALPFILLAYVAAGIGWIKLRRKGPIFNAGRSSN